MVFHLKHGLCSSCPSTNYMPETNVALPTFAGSRKNPSPHLPESGSLRPLLPAQGIQELDFFPKACVTRRHPPPPNQIMSLEVVGAGETNSEYTHSIAWARARSPNAFVGTKLLAHSELFFYLWVAFRGSSTGGCVVGAKTLEVLLRPVTCSWGDLVAQRPLCVDAMLVLSAKSERSFRGC